MSVTQPFASVRWCKLVFQNYFQTIFWWPKSVAVQTSSQKSMRKELFELASQRAEQREALIRVSRVGDNCLHMCPFVTGTVLFPVTWRARLRQFMNSSASNVIERAMWLGYTQRWPQWCVLHQDLSWSSWQYIDKNETIKKDQRKTAVDKGCINNARTPSGQTMKP